MRTLVRAALAGAATGARTFTGLAAQVLTASPAARHQPDRFLAHRAVRALAALGASQELVLDKLPRTPSRTEPAGLGGRALTAAVVGVIAARRDHAARPPLPGLEPDPDPRPNPTDDLLPDPGLPAAPAPEPRSTSMLAAVAVATTSAVLASWLGVRWRAWAAGRFGSDLPGALAEDAWAVGLAALATRGPRSR